MQSMSRAAGILGMRGVVTLAIVLVAALALCAIHVSDEHDHGVVNELCVGVAVVSLTVVLLARPLPIGWALAVAVAVRPATALHVLDPPPKASVLS
jgi:hypothetical protein